MRTVWSPSKLLLGREGPEIVFEAGEVGDQGVDEVGLDGIGDDGVALLGDGGEVRRDVHRPDGTGSYLPPVRLLG